MKDFFVRMVQSLRGPVAKLLGKNEPAIAGGIVGVAVTVATHYGLALTAQQQTYVSSGSFLFITWVVHQLVVPNSKVAVTTDQVKKMGPDLHITVRHTHHHTHTNVTAKKAAPRKKAVKKTTARKKTAARRR